MPGHPPTTPNAFRQRCHELTQVLDRARAYPMEVWLQPDTEGLTLKERYAEVAALAVQLRDDIRRWVHQTAPPTVGAAPVDRRRRPVAVLLTEIHSCLGTAREQLLNAPQTATVPDSMHELMERLEALLTPESAPESPPR